MPNLTEYFILQSSTASDWYLKEILMTSTCIYGENIKSAKRFTSIVKAKKVAFRENLKLITVFE